MGRRKIKLVVGLWNGARRGRGFCRWDRSRRRVRRIGCSGRCLLWGRCGIRGSNILLRQRRRSASDQGRSDARHNDTESQQDNKFSHW